MKYLKVLSLMLSTTFLMKGMDLEKLDLETNGGFNLQEATDAFSKAHGDLMGMIPKDQWQSVIKTMQERRYNLVDYVLNRKNHKSLTPEEIQREYGDNATNDFQSYIENGKAFLHVMGDHSKEVTQKVQTTSLVKLSTLKLQLNKLNANVDSKKSKKTNKVSNNQKNNTVVISTNNNNNNNPTVVKSPNNDIKGQLVHALHQKHAGLYRKLPSKYTDPILDKFIEQYPALANNIIKDGQQSKSPLKNKTMQKRDVSTTNSSPTTTPSNVLNVSSIENVLIQDVPALQSLYEKYKVVAALLESFGINVNGIEEAVNNDIQLLVNDIGDGIIKANSFIEGKLQTGCTIL